MKIVFDNFLRIYKAKEETLDEFREQMTFKNPARGMAEARLKRGQYVDVIPPKWIRCYEECDDHLAIPVGVGLDFVKKIGKQYKELLQVQDVRSDGHEISFKVPVKGRFKEFEPHQRKIIDTGISNYNAVISAPTGSGKTIAAFGIIERIQSSTIVLVDSTDLLEQWCEDLEDLCDGGFSIGIMGAGTKRWGDVTIATVQTLRQFSLQKQEEIKTMFGIVIVDEVHKAAAPIFVNGSTMFASRFKLGLSATTYRKDKKDFVFKSYIGDIKLEITDKEVEETGRIVPMSHEFIDTGYALDYSSIDEDVDNYPQACLSDFDRTVFVVECVKIDIEMGFVPLIVSHRVPHLKHLAKLLQDDGLRVALIHGAIKKKDRKTIRRAMIDGEYDVMVANEKIFGQAMNVPILSSVHVPFYTNNKGLLKQISGRVRRGFGDKTYGKIIYYRDDVYVIEKDKRTREPVKCPVDTFVRTYKQVAGYFKKWGYLEETEKPIIGSPLFGSGKKG